VLAHIDAQLPAYTAQLKDWVRIPSISAGAQEDTATAIHQASDFLAADFKRIGLLPEKVQIGENTNPLIIACSPDVSADRPTVLVYGHYDVQGVDNPRSAWDHDPFGAIEQDGHLISRGASDNKGPSFAHVKAVEAILTSTQTLPLNVVFLIEGEEECGSGALTEFIATGGLYRFGPIACTIISDTSMYGPDKPSLTLGLRGMAYTELTVHGPRQDVHSGLFGGIIHNPNQVLVQALAALFSHDGHIAVPGFYDDVQPISPQEKAIFDQLHADEADYQRELGVAHLTGEPGYSILERRWTRPTLEINYLNGGSPRTVIPAQACAAVSSRLVPNQNPERIATAIQQHIRDHLPTGIQAQFSNSHSSPAYYLDPDHPLVPAALAAMRTGFGVEPLLTREGGSIPVVVDIANHTQAPVLLIGLGQISDNWHGPNERFSLHNFHRGIRTSAALLYEIAQR